MIFENEYLKDPLLRILGLVDHCNHAVKQGDFHQADLNSFYDLKDRLMRHLHANRSGGLAITLFLVPYLKRCGTCKDMAGARMRSDANPKGFEYYLDQIPPCSKDVELRDMNSVEMQVKYMGRVFCFHVPAQQARLWGWAPEGLERKRDNNEPIPNLAVRRKGNQSARSCAGTDFRPRSANSPQKRFVPAD